MEPVFGSLINFTGMRKINTRDIESANKVMLMAAMAYNLKKYMKYVPIKTEASAKCLKRHAFLVFNLIRLFFSPNKALENTTMEFYA